MRFGVLGPLTVVDAEGNRVRLRGDRQRSLLAMLLMNAGKPVLVDSLVEALWPELPPKSYASNLHTYVSRLRERVGDIRIEHVGSGYRLMAAPGELDLLIFETEVAAGRKAARAGEAAVAADHFRKALAQWRGPALADVDVAALDPAISTLDAERLTVLEDCAEAELSIGKHAGLIGELEAFLAAHPLRERAAAQLMLALRRSGRQAEALAVYARTRTVLVDELGVEPGPELRQAHATVLSGEDHGKLHDPAPPSWPICQLPPCLGDFTGRESEVDIVSATLADAKGSVPVTVISGEPGAGKSTLAVHAAHRIRKSFPDGQLYVHLSGTAQARKPIDVLADLLRALGVSGPAIPDGLEARAAAYRGRLTDRKVLVVLDDAASPEQVRALFPGTPGCAVLVTSRRRLSTLDGAYRVPLGPFGDQEAAALLRHIVGTERVAAEHGAATRIVASCGNLPLALRIAGTRLAIRPHLSLRALADRLDNERHRLDELSVSDRTVRTSIALSYHALSLRAQSTLHALAQCGDISAPAWAIAVLVGKRGENSADAVMEELVEASLLTPIGVDATGEPRYRLHNLVRVFAQDQRRQAPTVSMLIDAALGLADTAARELPWTVPLPLRSTRELPEQPLHPATVGRLVADPHTWFAIEQRNLLTAIGSIFRAGRRAEAVLLLERLTAYLWLNGHYADMRSGHDTIRQLAARAGDRVTELWAEANIAVVIHARGEHEEAERRFRACALELERQGEPRMASWAMANLARCLLGLGRAEEALVAVRDAITLAGPDPDLAAVAHIELTRPEAFNKLGLLHESVEANRRTLATARLTGKPLAISLALRGLAWSLTLTGQPRTALGLAEESVSILRAMPVSSSLARSLRTLGAICAGLGERERAITAYTEAHQLAGERGERPRELSCARAIAASWIGEGRITEAIASLEQGLAEFKAMGSVASAVVSSRVLARAYEAAGEPARAAAMTEEADRLADPRDASATVLSSLLFKLTEDAGRELVANTSGATPR
ncbi:SARP family transcriptional regulator [Prauserella marina]|uniref:DNA-binding transcriptional activator of the SARP family n=1 Tax=Prauserella marina TaxID=530584 RepID=A0A222VVJ1_9PSEU|nr:AfsR/SARP family transcriptional regulator [Prauserella marina]ASR37925.1 SARP family transcriptional regulator [Prauserella marina]PWV73134.1 DNA-binding SARP family transcriptional activator [Prauserella marina]SDD71030.1 DNA-binding transcriptional activator of the SARP family [Prauserella marina]